MTNRSANDSYANALYAIVILQPHKPYVKDNKMTATVKYIQEDNYLKLRSTTTCDLIISHLFIRTN